MNIMRKIYNLKQEEIDPFIKSRLQELKNDRNSFPFIKNKKV